MLGRTDSRLRLFMLLLAVVVMAGGMMARLAYWQLEKENNPASAYSAGGGGVQTIQVPAHRGTIYDRTGTIVLAQSIDMYRVVADPVDMTAGQKTRTIQALADYLSLGDQDVAKIKAAMDKPLHYVILATEIDANTVQEMETYQATGGLAGISFEEQPVRVYPQLGGAPNSSLAAQLLGFVNASGQGQYGIEQAYDDLLAGKPEILQVNPSIPGPDGTKIIDPGTPGKDIRTTIDANLQLQVEQEVFAAWVADRARAVSSVVMDPETGDLLAEASYPTYDANNYSAVYDQNPDLFIDPIISQSYEPGSVFKMLTASAALQTRTTLLTTRIDDTGILHLPGGEEIADADRHSRGWMTFADIIAWSRNVGASQAAFRLGRSTGLASKTLYQTWQAYGIGTKTGVDLAGEVTGIVRNPASDPWAKVDLANASFGQGVSVTPLQVLRAYAAMSNGGYLVTPRVTMSDTRVDETTVASTPGPQIISASLSSNLTGLMTHVVTAVPSYAQRTYIPGYYIGGKTGTAQIWDQRLDGGKGAWKVNDFNYSFYGWIGTSKPDLVVGCVIYEGTPTRIGQGLLDMPVQSYELFRRIATDAVTTERIPRNPNGPEPPGHGKATPQG